MFSKSAILQAFSSHQASLNGSAQSAFNSIQKKAMEGLENLHFPDTKQENWRYTSLRSLQNEPFPTVEYALNPKDLPKIPDLDAYYVVLKDGAMVPELSELPSQHGLTIQSIKQAQNTEAFKQHFAKYSSKTDYFAVMNTAMAQQGIFIHLADNLVLEKPIYILHISANAHHTRNLIVVERNSQLTVVEDFFQHGAHTSFNNLMTEVFVGKNANLTHYKLQTNLKESYHVGTTEIHQEADSNFSSFSFGWSGAMVRNNLNATQGGKNCLTNFYGVYAPTKKQRIDNQTFIHHLSPNCQSNEIYKGLIDDEAKAVFNGKILVAKDAQKINAYQSNKNILLSEQATIYAKPQLEIFADDVKCSHGATVGQLDKTQLFYLQSRGIDKAAAQGLLLTAFVAELIDLCGGDAIKHHLYQSFSQR